MVEVLHQLIQEMKAICAHKVQVLGGFYADQFGSKDVVLGYEPMGTEIAGQIDQKVDLFCASVGTCLLYTSDAADE